MKAILCLLILGSNYLVCDALLSWLLGGGNDDSCCAKPGTCVEGACYRTFNGSCNNMNKPSMCMAGMPYGRYCQDCYSDRKSAFPKCKSGNALPSARILSYELSPEKPDDDDSNSQLTQQYGQFVAHDMSLASGVTQMNKPLIPCCDKDKNILTKLLGNPRCAAVLIHPGDPVYDCDDTPCLHLARTLTTNDKKCHSPYNSYTPITDVTGWLDTSMIYGNSDIENKGLRLFKGGLLQTVTRNGQEWPPQQPDPSGTCTGQSATDPCYLVGDERGNQSPQLTIMHVVFLREHNRLCRELSKLNPSWNDSKLFQVVRRIIIAIFQRITYYHYLPKLVGLDTAIKKKLIYPEASGCVDDYDPKVDSAMMVEFATGANRFYHTMVRGSIGMYGEDRQKNSTIFLRNSYFKTATLEQDDNLAGLVRGLATQQVRMSDPFFDVDITQYLFSNGNNELGGDLRALDIQRARDHGVCSYVEIRKACGLPVPKSFADLRTYGISQENVDKLKELYECVADIEYAVVGALEPMEPNARAGATYMCVITEQYYRTRTGDRYFHENCEEFVSFTPDQLNAIRTGASMSRLFCDNVLGIESMQPDAFRLITEDNPLTECKLLPKIDLQCWVNSEC